jgi:hypothetical protein
VAGSAGVPPALPRREFPQNREEQGRAGKSREEQGRAGNFLILEQGIDPPETGNNREFSSL